MNVSHLMMEGVISNPETLLCSFVTLTLCNNLFKQCLHKQTQYVLFDIANMNGLTRTPCDRSHPGCLGHCGHASGSKVWTYSSVDIEVWSGTVLE